jgi:CRP/FNR family cyclic AMP-dependent transcriptional regulator
MRAIRAEADDGAEGLAVTLARVSLFERLGHRRLRRLAERMTRRTYPAGDVIVRAGDTSMSFYVILAGTVRIVLDAGEHGEVVFGEVGALDFFGEMGLVDDVPRLSTVVAVERTECALLGKWDFDDQLRNDPAVALALLPVLNARIRELEARLAREARR